MEKKIKVSWMHCKACELLIENKLNEIDWVKVKDISSKTWEVKIEIKNENKLNEIQIEIKELWYWIGEHKNIKKNSFFDYTIIFLLFVIIWILIFLFKDIELFSSILKVENYSFFIITLIWIIASMSSCLAITWWIILWFSKYLDTSKWIKSHIKIQSMFHIWRILWFFVFGWILWSIWKYIWFIWDLNKVLLLIAWILMIYMWLNIVNIVPSITKLWISMPKSIWNKILSIKNPIFTPLIWALTFFLPCWFTQSMQVLAASSWGFLSWALIMTAFAIWTLPVLFLVWVGNSYFKDKNFDLINKIIWVIVIYFWIFILSGFSNLIAFNSINKVENNQNINQQEKLVEATHNWLMLVPENIILEWSNKYKLKIIPESNWLWCKYSLTVPWIDNKEYRIQKWVPIILSIENIKSWKYDVVCWSMWMSHWTIEIK